MYRQFPTLFILSALSAGIHTKPLATRTIQGNDSLVTETLAAKTSLISASPSPVLTFTDNECKTSQLSSYDLIYDEPLHIQIPYFMINRELVENEQLDLSTAQCAQYLGSPVGAKGVQMGILPVSLDSWTPSMPPAIGLNCYAITSGPAGCVRLWHY